jgi:hypothetical protein
MATTNANNNVPMIGKDDTIQGLSNPISSPRLQLNTNRTTSPVEKPNSHATPVSLPSPPGSPMSAPASRVGAPLYATSPGYLPANIYDATLPWWRAAIRRKLVQNVERESPVIARMQVCPLSCGSLRHRCFICAIALPQRFCSCCYPRFVPMSPKT